MKKPVFIFYLFFLLCSFLSPVSLSEAAAPQPGKPAYNLLLITIDTLRADHLGCYGYQDVNTPAIDSLASEGILFTQALTPVPITLPSHVSIMTGLYPVQHGIWNNGNFVLQQDVVTLAEVMKSNGYRTGACVGAFVLNSMFGLDQGFDTYNDSLPGKKRSSASPMDSERRAEEVTKSALEWLEKNHSQPFFLWVHYFDPHAIYFPPPPFRENYKHRLYDGEIAYTDKCLGDLLDGLKRMGATDKTVVVLTADHGEGLGEHGESTHTIFIYDATLRVPLIIKAPAGLMPAAKKMIKKVPQMVTTLDIFPTIMDLFSIQPDGVSLSGLPGKSLLPLVSGGCQALHQEVFCETLYPELNFGWSRIEGIRTGDWKYIKAPRSELYHLLKDPAENSNLLTGEPELAIDWEKKLGALKEQLRKEKRQPQIVQNDAALRRLEGLGYFRSTKKDPAQDSQKRPDPKDMIQLIDGIDRGLSYYYLDSYELAYNEFKKVIDANPENVSATFYLACVEERMGKYEQARDRFLHLLALQPGYLEARNHLGIVYHQLGQLDQALKEFKLALEEAKYADVYYNLGVVYKEMGLKDEAISAAKSAIELDPDYGDAINLLGEMALERGRLEEANKYLEEAYQYFTQVLKLEPNHLEAHNNLGVIYFHRSKMEDALREFSQAAAIDPNSAEAHNNLGSLFLAQGSYDKAKDAFQKAMKIKPGYSEALVNLGTAWFKEGNLEKAQDIYLQATRLFPNNQDAWNCLGLTHFTRKDYQGAIDHFETALKTGPARADVYISIGKTYLSLRSFDKSLAALKKAVEVDPHNKEAHLIMGHVLFDELGRAQEAVVEWEEARRLDPSDPVPLMNLAAVSFQAERYPEAIMLWKKALEIDPDSNDACLHLGTAYLKQNNIEEAIRSWQKILDRAPSHTEALINLGTAFYRKGDFEKAVEVWRKAEDVAPEDPKIHYNLALALMYRRNYRESLEELEEVLRLEPDNTQARMLMETARQQESY